MEGVICTRLFTMQLKVFAISDYGQQTVIYRSNKLLITSTTVYNLILPTVLIKTQGVDAACPQLLDDLSYTSLRVRFDDIPVI